MQPITTTLLAAARSRRGRPYVRVTIQDRRLRMAPFKTGLASTRLTDAVALGPDIHRIVMIGSTLYHARITSPDTPASWPGTWNPIATSVDGSLDCALSAWAGNLDAFYINAAGQLCRVRSTDTGTTWSAPAVLRDWPYTPAYLAAAGRGLFYARHTQLLHAQTYDATGAPAFLEQSGLSAPTIGITAGIAADPYKTDRYHLAYITDGALYLVTYDETADQYGTPAQILPAGNQAGPANSTVTWPAITHGPDGTIYLTVIDRLSTGLWQQAALLAVRAYPHPQRVCQLAANQTTSTRLPLAPSATRLFAAYENNVLAAPWYASDSPDQNLTITPTRYEYHAHPLQGAYLHAFAPNVKAAYTRPAYPGQPAAALQPLATVTVSRGYTTDAGNETIDLQPLYLLDATVTTGAEGHDLDIHAADAWTLLELYYPPDTTAWTGATIRTIAAEIAAWIGLPYADAGETQLGATLPRFIAPATEPASGTLAALLALAGAIPTFTPAGYLTPRILATHLPTPAAVGPYEILSAAYTVATQPLTSYRAWSDTLAAASAPTQAAMRLGQLLARNWTDHRGSTAALLTNMAELRARLARLEERTERLTLPLRPDLELYDQIDIAATPFLNSATDGTRRILELHELWNAARPTYTTRLRTAAQPT